MQAQDLTLSDYAAMLRRRWRQTLITGAVVALGSIYFTYSLPSVFESSATILIEQQGIPTDFVQTTIDAYAEELLQTIYQRVAAAPEVTDLIERLDLYPEERQSLPAEELVQVFRDSMRMAPQNVTTVNSRTGREAIITFGFQIFFQDPDPVKARDVTEELSELFLSYNAALRAESTARTTAFLDTEAAQVQDKLAELAERIADFKELNAGNLPDDQGVNLSTWERLRGELTQIDTLLRETGERKALLETELAETPRFRPVLDGSGEPVLGGVDRLAEAQQELIRLRGRYSENHPQIINLRREITALSSSSANLATLDQQLRADLEVRRQELAAAEDAYSENHPDVIRLRRTVQLLEQQLDDVQNETRASAALGPAQPNNPVYLQLATRIDTAETELEDLTRQRTELSTRIAEFERRRSQAPQTEREFNLLTQEQDLLLERYGELRSLGDQAALGQALETGDSGQRLTIIEPARVPANPVSPDRTSLSFLGIILALALALGVAALTEAADTTVRGQRDVYQLLEIPPLGIIPYVENTTDRFKRLAANTALGVLLVGGTLVTVLTVLS